MPMGWPCRAISCEAAPMPAPVRELCRANRHAFWLALLTVALSIGWFFLDGKACLNLADEGYLWYGVRAVRAGQVPMRDFQAYDPGRYVWGAAWSHVLGDGLLAMRFSCVLFGCLGVLAGLLVARRLSQRWTFLGVVALLLCVWMHPRYKAFEQSIALMSVYAAVLLLEKPSVRRHFCVGVFGGLMAFVGRNHGAYHVLAFGLLIAWAAWGEGWRAWFRRTLVWIAGLLLGYLPQWLMFIFAPGYFHQFTTDLIYILAKGTNLPRPVLWPWFVSASEPLWSRLPRIVEGCLYVALLLFLLLAAWRLVRLDRFSLGRQRVLLAAGCVSLAYTHYVFSRPDIVHLGHAAPAMALGWIALGFSFEERWPQLGLALAPVLLAVSVLANCLEFGISARLFTPADIETVVELDGHRITTSRFHAQIVTSAQKLAGEIAKPDEPILFLPNLIALYPITGRFSPTREIFNIFPASPEEDRALLAQIEAANVQWVMIYDFALDGRDDLRFRHTNPIVYAHFAQNFDLVPLATLPAEVTVLHRRR
jgi:hypothetical protein